MRNRSWVVKISALIVLGAAALLVFFAQNAHTQAQGAQARAAVPARITQAIDESQLTRLTGNTHPLARPEFDRGAAAPGMMLHRMLLVLNRAPEQEAALQQLILDLHDKSSPSFHKWLTPEQFGQQFGPADSDIQTVTSWLESHGFQVANVAKGRNVIEFSGTVSQLNEAFHTGFHKYFVNGEDHWANTNDPEIPAALAPVVGGIASLHNFVKKPHVHYSNRILTGTVTKSKAAGSTQLPAVNFQGGDHGVGAADFAKIYNVPNKLLTPAPATQFNGDGTVIGVVGRTNINVSDITNYRNLFGGPPNPTILVNGPDPGNLGGGEEIEALLDVTESGQAAPNATVDFVVSEITETTDGVDLSEVFIIDNNLSDVMTESFGLCEQQAGAARANLENSLAEEATSQGISFFASTGDSGADGCDDPNSETVAKGPIAVQVPAALPFAIAVGGTMFPVPPADASFWAAQEGTNHESALGYITESVWNESCSAAQCGNKANIGSGGGGSSSLFSKPSYQSGVAGTDTNRDIPDVSLNAAAGHDSPIICDEDFLNAQGASCVPSAGGGFSVLPVGGTSASTPGFAGLMALVVQATHQRQGLANFVLYNLAAAEATSPGLAACNASTGKGPTSAACVFNDVTSGNNTVPNTPNASGFSAASGYDKATGLGSVNAANLISKWGTGRTVSTVAHLTPVSPAPPTVIPHGTSVAISGTVTSGSGIPTGDVSIISIMGIDAIPTGIAEFTLSGGAFSGTTTNLPGGQYTLIAHYAGDGKFLPSDSSPVNVSVGKENSQMQIFFKTFDVNGNPLNSNATSAAYGANSLIRINVFGATSNTCSANSLTPFACPTGTVILKNNGANFDGNPRGTQNGAFPLNSLGYTEDQFEVLPVGTNMLSATYSGDGTFNAITTAVTDTITISQATTSTTVGATPSSVAPGGSVTLTATISTQSFGNPPTGTVTFFNGTAQIGSAVNVSGSVNSNNGLAVGTATLHTTLSSIPPIVAPNPRNFPTQLLYYILVALLIAALSFRSKRGRLALAGLAVAILIALAMPACGGGGGGGGGAHTDSITAKYSGDTNYAASTSAAVSVTVQ